MATYVVMTKLTSAGRKVVEGAPERVLAVKDRVRELGARITKQYAVLGEYDFVTFVEAPDNATLARISAELGALGTMRMTAYPTIEMDRFVKSLSWELYRTEPHRWQTSLWARAVRRVGRYWVATRHANQFCKPLTIEGQDNLKNFKGPAIVIANHSSHLDTPVILAALPERIKGRLLMGAAADKWYRRARKRHWWYSLFHGAFPIHRGGGTKQLEYPKSLFSRGWSILLFPEGTRSRSGQVARFRHGVTLMAMGAHVPVIPLYIEGLREIMPKGSRQPLRPGPVTARIGKPVSLEGVASAPEGTDMLENAMRALAGMAPHRAHPAMPPEAALAGGAARSAQG